MLLRYSTLAATCLILLCSCICPPIILVQATRHHPHLHNELQATIPRKSNETTQNLICRPFGECQPCPGDQLEQPYCQPFGNRRQTHCVNDTLSSSTGGGGVYHHSPSETLKTNSGSVEHQQKQQPAGGGVGSDPLNHPGMEHPESELLAWEACGRLVKQERADFYEFVACNVFFAIIAIFGVLVRSKRMQALQARTLAARIGLTRSTGRR
ncbi:hypothetical protein BDN72DRAFT_419355 [Pluteus cervinus]|uniref:Uncharacterized protein n=1 Tax=Pluteus cervinus TaxID=181527 RepID=A0ACD3A881_9AGAR|nr:hypothetical protein BDN72DRAFT_419355 [Pluteus cervinus]